jgi:hypothetical protein
MFSHQYIARDQFDCRAAIGDADGGKHCQKVTTARTFHTMAGTPAPDAQQTPPDARPGDARELEKWKCVICFGSLQQPVVTPCGRMFCWPCISEWLNRSSSCPGCTGVIDRSNLIPVYGQGVSADLTAPPPPRDRGSASPINLLLRVACWLGRDAPYGFWQAACMLFFIVALFI